MQDRRCDDHEEPTAPARQGERPRATREQLVQLIRFNLDELSSTNGHHRFEDICRHFARERLAPNILPATGPVGVGGDRGRDFETFRSYLRDELGPYGAFAGALKDGGALAFLCTLQRESIPAKILSDVSKVMAAGTEVATIYALLGSPLPKGKRDQLQDQVRDEHGVHLEVLDGRAIAEALAAHDIFWIAEEFLSVPADMRPPPSGGDEDVPEWYLTDRARWRKRGAVPPRMAALLDVVDGLRHATFNSGARADLPFWIELIRPLASDDVPGHVAKRARYELAVAHIRGLGDLRPADDAARRFLRDAADHDDDPARLQDAATLLGYAMTAVMLRHTTLGADELSAINERLRERIRDMLGADPAPVRRARLLEILGHLAILPGRTPESQPGSLEGASVPVLVEQARREGVPEEAIATFPATDLAEAMRAWTELAELLEQTPLYPVESWTEVLDFWSPLLLRQPGWERVEHSVDAALARNHGADAAATRARDRALRLLEQEQMLDGLRELHRAVRQWWSGDSLRPALLCMLGVANVYKQLRLPQAAKQYALIVACGASGSGGDDVADLIPHAILMVSEIDYAAGAWASAVEYADVGLIAQNALVDPSADPWASRDFQTAFLTIGMALRAAEQLVPDVLPAVEAVARRHGMLDAMRQRLQDATGWSPRQWAEVADDQLLGRPFDDAGAQRTIRFAALGLEWYVSASSEYRSARAAERLAASAQILLVELAEEDLQLVPGRTELNVRLLDDPDQAPTAARDVAASRCPWVVHLRPLVPGTPFDVKTVFTETLSVLTQILMDASLLSPDVVMRHIEGAFARGLGDKLAYGRPFDELAEIISPERYALTPRNGLAPLEDDARLPTAHEELALRPEYRARTTA